MTLCSRWSDSSHLFLIGFNPMNVLNPVFLTGAVGAGAGQVRHPVYRKWKIPRFGADSSGQMNHRHSASLCCFVNIFNRKWFALYSYPSTEIRRSCFSDLRCYRARRRPPARFALQRPNCIRLFICFLCQSINAKPFLPEMSMRMNSISYQR